MNSIQIIKDGDEYDEDDDDNLAESFTEGANPITCSRRQSKREMTSKRQSKRKAKADEADAAVFTCFVP